MFQAAILVNWGGNDPPNGGAVVVHILILMLRYIVEHVMSIVIIRRSCITEPYDSLSFLKLIYSSF